MTTESESDVKATQADATTGSAQAGAGAQSKQALAGGEAAGDINQTENDVLAMKVANANLKRLLAMELNTDAALLKDIVESSQRSRKQAQDLDANLNNLTVQVLQGAIERTNRLMSNAIGSDKRSDGNDEQYDKAADEVSIDNLTKMNAQNKVDSTAK